MLQSDLPVDMSWALGGNAMLGSQDLIVGLVVVLVLFGAKKLPELAGSIGKSLKEFKKGVSEATEEEPAKGAGPPAAPAPARKCASCEVSLDASWQHCPRCGTATAVDPAGPRS